MNGSSVAEVLKAAERQLSVCSDSPRADAEILLAHVSGRARGTLFAWSDQAVDAASLERYTGLLLRREQGEPVAYLTGEREFWSLNLEVNPAVLVPRPETETLVEWALELMQVRAAADSAQLRIADLGTGSGAIALALARELPHAHVVGTDVSSQALAVARRNARRLNLPNAVFELGNWCEALGEPDPTFDLIVSNPPYIPVGDPHLQRLHREPLSALTDGADGLMAIRRIIAEAHAWMLPGAWLLLEHGFDQGSAVRRLLGAAGYEAVQTRADLGGNDRISGGCIGSGA